MKPKNCPKCGWEFVQLKKGGCPACGIGIFYDANRVPRLKTDKEIVDLMIEEVEEVIYKLKDVRLDLKQNSVERKFGYRFVDQARNFLWRQDAEVDDEFPLKALRHHLQGGYWAMKVKSLSYLSRSWEKMLADYYIIERKNKENEQYEISKAAAEYSGRETLNLEYGTI